MPPHPPGGSQQGFPGALGGPTGGQPPVPPGRPPYGAPTGGNIPPYTVPTGGNPGMGQHTPSGPHVPPGQALPPGALPPGSAQGTPLPPHGQGRPGPPPGGQAPGQPSYGAPTGGNASPYNAPTGGNIPPYNVPTGGNPGMGPHPANMPPGPPPGMPPGPPGPPGAPPGMPPDAPTTVQQAYQAPPPGPPAPALGQSEPMFPPEAMGATQNINAVPATPGNKNDRPLYRDEVPDNAGVDTAQFDIQGLNDYDQYDGYDGYDDYDDHADSRAKKRKFLMGVAGFAVLLVVAGGSVFYFASSGGISSGGASATTIANEEDDPNPLATDSLFPESIDVEGQGTFSRVAVDDSEDCATGAHGGYGEVLTENKCRQLVRASYLSEDEGHAVTIGVVAMPTEEEAATAMDAQDLESTQWFAGLPGEEGTPTERLGHSGGHGSSGQWGRYLLFSLAANSDGTDKENSELSSIGESFLDETFDTLSEKRG